MDGTMGKWVKVFVIFAIEVTHRSSCPRDPGESIEQPGLTCPYHLVCGKPRPHVIKRTGIVHARC